MIEFMRAAIVRRFSPPFYRFTAGKIRSRIKSAVVAASSKEVNWPKLIASGDSVGLKVEEEIDRARRDEAMDLSREGGSMNGNDHDD